MVPLATHVDVWRLEIVQVTDEVLHIDWYQGRHDAEAPFLPAERDRRLCEALQGGMHWKKSMQHVALSTSSHDDRLERRGLSAYASEEGAHHELCRLLFRAGDLHS